jgi:peptide-methionine (S)-S-oxide reductase
MMGQGKSLAFENAKPAAPLEGPISPRLALGAGCYWGTEKYIKKDFQKSFPGSIKTVSVGFMAPETVDPRYKNPTYQQVCTGASGHIEVAYVELNDPATHYEELIRFFFQFHDPTTKNRQGNDKGFQYASWIFCDDEQQTAIANRVMEQLQEAVDGGAVTVYAGKSITTKVTPLTEYTKASQDHQEYLMKNPQGYCNHRMRFTNWPVKKEEAALSSSAETK